jgi:hypothetical protein
MKCNSKTTTILIKIQQWEQTSSKDRLTKTQNKYQNNFIGLMASLGKALKHSVAPLILVEFAISGCIANCGVDVTFLW